MSAPLNTSPSADPIDQLEALIRPGLTPEGAEAWKQLVVILRQIRSEKAPEKVGRLLTRDQVKKRTGRLSESALKRWLVRWRVRAKAHNRYDVHAVDAALEREANSGLYSRRKPRKSAVAAAYAAAATRLAQAS